MKTKIYKITAFLLVIALHINAQENEDIHVKMVKKVNGDYTAIDTILKGTKHGNIYFYSDSEIDESKLDSILTKFEIDEDDIKVVELKEHLDSDSIKHLWYSISKDSDELGKSEIAVILEDASGLIQGHKKLKLISGDLEKELITRSDGKKIFIAGNGEDEVVIHELLDSTFTWTIDTSDFNVIVTEDIHLYTDSDKNAKVFTVSTDDKEYTTVSEIMIKGGDSECKTIELIVDGKDGEDANFIELEEALKEAGENVKVVKYETEGGTWVVKARISDCELTNEEEQTVKELGLEDKNELELKGFKLYPNPTEGVFSLEFELEAKEAVLIKVYNKNGESVFNDKIKKFDGFYSDEIDLTTNDSGIYFIKIIQGNKSITKKVLKN